MSRGNLILLVILAAVAGIWLAGRDWERDKPAGPAPRLFPDLNKEGADRIEISGGWQGTSWTLAREGSDWRVESAGGYPAKSEEVDRFLDGIFNLRKDNLVGASTDLQARTHTDANSGRRVTVSRQGEAIADFYVGKNPERGYQDFFIRREGEESVLRTRTLLTRDRERSIAGDPYSAAPTGFDWHNYVNTLSTKWVEPEIWDLTGAEAEEVWITRAGQYEAKLVKSAEDRWDLHLEGQEPQPADADVADGILQQVRRLSLYDVVGTYEGALKEYGLDSPEITVVLKLRKKVEKKSEPPAEPPKEGEPKEGEPKEGEEKKEEYVTFHRSIEVGKKVSRSQYDSYSDEMKTVDYYAIHVGPAKDMTDPDEAKRAGFVFLVSDYTAGQLRKDLDSLRAKPEEKAPGEEKGGAEAPPEQPPAEAEKPPETPPAEEKPVDEQPAGESETETGEDEGCGCGD